MSQNKYSNEKEKKDEIIKIKNEEAKKNEIMKDNIIIGNIKVDEYLKLRIINSNGKENEEEIKNCEYL